MPARRLLTVLAALVCAGCFSPDIPDGKVPCGVNRECPDDFECRSPANLCFKKGGAATVVDAALTIDSGPTPDAFVPPPDAPLADALPSLDSAPPPTDAPRSDAPPGGQVTVSFMGTGGGSVMLNAMSCTSDCTLTFPLGTPVNLVPMASGNSTFAGWGGACSGSGPCSVLVDTTPVTIQVTFNQSMQQVQLTLVTNGPGTVQIAPQGTSCGTNCVTFAKGTPVTLTPLANAGFSFIGWVGAGCEVVGTMPCMFAINAASTVTARFCDAHHVVDAVAGMDSAAGTCVAPFKTVTKALSVAKADERVFVRPGLYSTANGETFPLNVPDSVTLVGDESGKGNGTSQVRLEGGGQVVNEPALKATVVLGSKTVLAGFLIIDVTAGAHGVVLTRPNGATGVTVRNNTVTMCGGNGIYADKAPGAVISGNVVNNQDQGTGIFISDAAPNAKLDTNVVVSNSFGVEVYATADLGGGSLQSIGGNTFSCNSETDLLVQGTAGAPLTISAQDNQWDHTPPGEGCASNIDLCRMNATVSTTGALLAPSSCP